MTKMGIAAKSSSTTQRSERVLHTASIAEAKENFSSYVRNVETARGEIIVQRRGVSVAKIVPFVEAELESGYGWMRGTVKELGDIVGPTGEEWDVNGE